MTDYYKARMEWDRGKCLDRAWQELKKANEVFERLMGLDKHGQLEAIDEFMGRLSDASAYACIAGNKIRNDQEPRV